MPERVLTDTPIDEVQSTTFSLYATLVPICPHPAGTCPNSKTARPQACRDGAT